ncbi:MAG: RDD family protein [Vicinamibacterales bacterium]
MTMTIDDYISRVLAAMPATTPERSQIAVELRGHIAERISDGRPAADVLRQLGDPVALAESYLSAVPLVSAPFGERVVAKLIDILMVVTFTGAVAALAGLFVPQEAWFIAALVIVLIGSSFVFGAYTVASEYHWGNTVGKRAMKLRVVRESGTRISLGQSLVRQLPMFLQVYVIDVLFALCTDRKQRAFELLSKTRVVTGRRREHPTLVDDGSAAELRDEVVRHCGGEDADLPRVVLERERLAADDAHILPRPLCPLFLRHQKPVGALSEDRRRKRHRDDDQQHADH